MISSRRSSLQRDAKTSESRADDGDMVTELVEKKDDKDQT